MAAEEGNIAALDGATLRTTPLQTIQIDEAPLLEQARPLGSSYLKGFPASCRRLLDIAESLFVQQPELTQGFSLPPPFASLAAEVEGIGKCR